MAVAMVMFWAVTACRLVDRYQRFGENILSPSSGLVSIYRPCWYKVSKLFGCVCVCERKKFLMHRTLSITSVYVWESFGTSCDGFVMTAAVELSPGDKLTV
jgi:hypothetical protein